MYKLIFIIVFISISCSPKETNENPKETNENPKETNENPKETIEMCIDNNVYTVDREEINYEWHIIDKELKETCDPELGCVKGKCLDQCIEDTIKSSQMKCNDNYIVEEKEICKNGEYILDEEQIIDCSKLSFETYDKTNSQIVNYNGECNLETIQCELKKDENYIQCESAHRDLNGNYTCNTNCIEGTTESKKECTDNDQYLITETKTCINDRMIITETTEENCNQDRPKSAICMDEYLRSAEITCSIETGCLSEVETILCDTGCQVNDYDKDTCIETCNNEGIIETKTECKDNSIIQKITKCESGIIKYNQETIETCTGLLDKSCEDNVLTKTYNMCQETEEGIAECLDINEKKDATCIDDKLTEEYCDAGDEDLNRSICENGYNIFITQTCENNNWKSTTTDSINCSKDETNCNEEDNTKNITKGYCEDNMCMEQIISINQDYSICTESEESKCGELYTFKKCEQIDNNPTINRYTEYCTLNEEKINIIVESEPCKDKTYCYSDEKTLINLTVSGCKNDGRCKYEENSIVCDNKCNNGKCQD